MLDKLYALATPWAKASKLQIQKNRMLGMVANVVYPFYCQKYALPLYRVDANREEKIVVSLTSYPARIEKVNLCVESLLRQNYKADKVVLWLSRKQFPKEFGDLPMKLSSLQEKGLTIRFVDEDYRSYKKFIYAANEYSGCVIVTTDDDTLYPEDWLEKLVEAHKKNPKCVACYRAHYITIRDGRINNYMEWEGLAPGRVGPDMRLIAIGVGGVLYPADFWQKGSCDIDLIKKLCPTTDDLWLKAMGIINGYPVVKVNENSKEWFTVKGSQSTKLSQKNAGTEAVNDKAWENLDEHFSISKKLMPYI